MQKARLIVGIRKGLYDPETEMYSLPTCFDSEQSARRALQSMARELDGLPDTQLNVVRQRMVSCGPRPTKGMTKQANFHDCMKQEKTNFRDT